MITTTTFIKTAEQVKRNYALAQSVESTSTRKTFFDQAFGMVILASVLIDPDEYGALCDLWHEYKVKFETLIYGE